MLPDSDERELALEGARARVALLSCDLCDHAALDARRDPAAADVLRRRLERHVQDIVRAHGGVVTRCNGAGVLAVFGMPCPAEDDARRAIEAALALHQLVRELASEGAAPPGRSLCLHSGIHAGLVFVPASAPPHGLSALTGDALELAVALASAAERDQILVSCSTLQSVEPFFTTEAARALQLQGEPASLRVQRVTGRSRVRTRFEVRIRSGLTPLVGRAPERSSLLDVLGEAAQGSGRLVLIKGAPGIGKTRLLEELRRGAAEGGARVLSGSCDGYLQRAPLEPFLQILRQYFGFQDEMTAADAVARVDATLDAHGAAEHSASILRLLALPAIEPAVAPQPARARTLTTQDALAALARLVADASRAAPIVLLLDDWQWADESSRFVLRFLCRQLRRQRLCIVVALRDDEGVASRLRAHMTLTLAPLSELECKVIVGELRAPDLDLRLTRALHERSGGNPLLLEELCRALPNEVVTGRQALDRCGIPSTLHGLIQARVSRLPRAVQRTLQIAAVIGLEQTASMLARVAGEPVEQALLVLRGEGLLDAVGDGDSHRFKHGATREVVYEALRPAERRVLHLQVARTLEATVGADSLVDHSEALAFHYRSAGQHEAAARHAALAGDKAAASSFLSPAGAHYAAALGSLDALPMTPELKRRWLAISAKWSAQVSYAPTRVDLQRVARAVDYAAELGDVAAQARNSHMLGWFHYVLGDHRQSIAQYTRARALAEQSHDAKLILQALITRGHAHGAGGEHLLARRYLDEAVARERALRPPWDRPAGPRAASRAPGRLYALALSGRAIVHADLGDFEQAIADNQEALAIVADSGHLMEPSVLLHQALIELRRGAWAACIRSAARASSLAERVGSAYVNATGIAYESYARFQQKPSVGTLLRLRRTVDWLEANDLKLYLSVLYAALAEAGLRLGEAVLAGEYAQRAIERASDGEPHGRISAHRTLASIAARRPDGRRLVEHHLHLALDFSTLMASKRELAITSLAAARLAVSAGVPRPLSIPGTLAELERMGMPFYAGQARALWSQQHVTL